MKNNILISVVTVSYNAVATIEQTLLSVINQTYPNIEYIIIDGGSTDGTVDIIKKYADEIVYWISEPDKGIYDAMNKGIKKANGEWINFINAGDSYYDKKSIEQIVLSFHEEGIIYYGDAWVNSICKRYWGKFSRRKLAMGNICHQAIFYPVVLMKAELFDLNYCIFADYVFNLKAWKIYRFKYISQIVCFYDFGGISTVNKDKDYNFRKVKRNLIIDSCGHINYIIGVIYRFLLSTKALIKNISHRFIYLH